MKAYRICHLWGHAAIFMLTTALCAAVQPVYSTANPQQHPDIENGIVVWAEDTGGDSDIYGVDLSGPQGVLISVAVYVGSDQDRPAIWNDRVAYQDNFEGDWDIWVTDISDPTRPVDHLVTHEESYYLYDQTHPAIHGNTVVWQSYAVVDDGAGGTIEDWDIAAADITQVNNAWLYFVDDFADDQAAPAVYRFDIVYQDNSFGDEDLLSADVWLKDWPQYNEVVSDDAALNQTVPAVWDEMVVYQQETGGGDFEIYARDTSQLDSEPFLIAGGPGLQQAPDIAGHIVVWQDNRNGNWDIFGYNLITKTEFQITAHGADQTEPAVSGTTVVWTDARTSPTQIYRTKLDELTAADCLIPLAADLNGDCRIDLADFAQLAEFWLACALNPIDACPQ